MVEIKVPFSPRFEAKSPDGQGGTVKMTGGQGKQRAKTALNLDDAPQISESEIAQLRLQIEETDRQLNNNPVAAELWRQRGELARRMRMKISALASTMNAAALSGDAGLLVDCADEFARQTPELAPILANQLSEIDKGKLLATIRSDRFSAEFHYALLLTYAGRFNDRDIFNQAIAGMKTAFAVDKRQFYSFNETRVAGGGGMNVENRVELLTLRDYPRINMNVRKFLLQVGCCRSYSAMDVTKAQLHKILSVNLDNETADRLVGREFSAPVTPISGAAWRIRGRPLTNVSMADAFLSMIRNWPEPVNQDNIEPAIARWLKLLAMDKIRETPLRDFFTGELYKPPFRFLRSEETTGRFGIIKTMNWLGELSLDELPEDSDGKPFARAIYQRFSDGKTDWQDFFRLAPGCGDMEALARSQRLLLLMVAEFGPHPEFARYLAPARIENDSRHGWDIYSLTMYCDMFRLSLAYRRPVDEQRLFNLLINRIPQPPNGWEDFRDSAEWIILCLLLTSSPVRRFQLDNLISRAMGWMQQALKRSDPEVFAETLTVLAFLSIGTLADLVPEKLEFHQLLEKRRVFWIQHAFAQASRGESAFADWLNACNV